MKKLLVPVVAMLILALMFKVSMGSVHSSNSPNQTIVREVVVDKSMNELSVTNFGKPKDAMKVIQAP